MKTSKLFAFTLAAVLTASAAAGCLDKKSSSSKDVNISVDATEPDNGPALQPQENVKHGPVGENKVEAEIGKEETANDTSFTLNAVIDGGHSDDGQKFLFFDITLKNATADAYTLSTLNNFYILTNDGEEIYSDVRSQLYANKYFNTEKYYADPFDIPSNGQFSGVIGGYTVDEDLNDFTLCFFPTGSDPLAKETVFNYKITADDIKEADSSLMK